MLVFLLSLVWVGARSCSNFLASTLSGVGLMGLGAIYKPWYMRISF